MKTAIVYISKHGTTEKVAMQIAEKMNVPKENLLNLRENRNPDISSYGRILIGGSIHAGMIQKRVKDFCEKNLDTLLNKEIGLFMCGMQKPQFEEEYNNAFPERLRSHSKAYLMAGGEFIFEKMNFLEKAIVRKVANISTSKSDINEAGIAEFAGQLA
jgi:menaquinone-dependent protoporphyrinogen oxidase